MDYFVLSVFLLVYLGMILGGLPGLAIDRTGIALLGAIALIAAGTVTPREAWDAVDVPTLGLLFGMMVVSSQFRLGGFYARLANRIAAAEVSPSRLLALLIAAAGGLSAVLGNDIICLAMTPMLVDGCVGRRLNPLPFLLALACATNIGSAATLIGNPQNILVGQALKMNFARYLLDGGVPSLLGLIAAWLIITRQFANRWTADYSATAVEAPPFDALQSGKAMVVTVVLMAAFLLTDWPREVVTLAAAGVLLVSRKMATQAMLGLVDWHLLVLFVGLFVVNHAMQAGGLLGQRLPIHRPDQMHTTFIREHHLDPPRPRGNRVVGYSHWHKRRRRVLSVAPSELAATPIKRRLTQRVPPTPGPHRHPAAGLTTHHLPPKRFLLRIPTLSADHARLLRDRGILLATRTRLKMGLAGRLQYCNEQ